MNERRSIADMLGEFLREAALLLLVFVPLDWFFQSRGYRLTVGRVASILVLPFGLLITGIVIERRRES
jgi:hypothetical protein